MRTETGVAGKIKTRQIYIYLTSHTNLRTPTLAHRPEKEKKKQLSGTDSRAEPDIKSTKQLFVKKFHFKFGMRAHPDIMCRV